jgi:YhcH/YjgK/YiaL family protein
VDGTNVFAGVHRYCPKPVAEAKWEAHRQYVDVQYVAEGVERMGYAPLTDALKVRQAYDPKKDAIFLDAQGDLFTVPAGSFAIFGPRDVHAPGLTLDLAGEPTTVCKVVVKCRG